MLPIDVTQLSQGHLVSRIRQVLMGKACLEEFWQK